MGSSTDDAGQMRRAAGPAEARVWPGMRSEYAWLPPHRDETVTGPDRVGVAFSAHRGVRWSVDGRWHRSTYGSGAVVVSGQAPIVWADVRDVTEALEITLDPDVIGNLTGSPATPLGALVENPVVGASDAVVLAVATRVRRAQVTGSALGDVEASTIAHLLARRVLTQYGHLRLDDAPSAGRLSDREVAAVTDLIEAEVAGRLTLERLAAVVHRSPFHFARSFKATVGMAPHQFVTARRMARARALLVGFDLPVVAVAMRVGFENVSHFRRVFRAHHGALPSDVRREIRSWQREHELARRAPVARSRS